MAAANPSSWATRGLARSRSSTDLLRMKRSNMDHLLRLRRDLAPAGGIMRSPGRPRSRSAPRSPIPHPHNGARRITEAGHPEGAGRSRGATKGGPARTSRDETGRTRRARTKREPRGGDEQRVGLRVEPESVEQGALTLRPSRRRGPTASAAEVVFGAGPDDKSTLRVSCQGDGLALCGPKSRSGTQHDEPLAIRDDGVRLARGARLADLHASAKGVRGGRKECLTGAGGDLGSDPAPFEFADLRCAVRVLGLDAEPAEHFAALGRRTLHLGPEAVGSQAVGLDTIEPNRPRMTNLLPERERLLAQKDAVTNGSVAVLRGEVLKQGGRDPPALRPLPGDEAEPLEFAQASLVRMRGAAHGRLEGVDAAAGPGDLGDLPVDRTHGPFGLGGQRHEVARAHRLS